MTTNTPQGLTGGPLTNEQAVKAPQEVQAHKRPTNAPASDKPTCGHTILGPRVGRNVVAWRKKCSRPVSAPGQKCYQHAGMNYPTGPGAR